MSPEEFIAVNFDYVIIGGGAAGLLLAARLSENPEVVVGVLEAGGDHLENPIVKIPGLALQTYEHPDLDWTFKTVPQVRIIPHLVSSHGIDPTSSICTQACEQLRCSGGRDDGRM